MFLAFLTEKERDGCGKKRTEREVKEVIKEVEERKARGTGAKSGRK